MEDDHCVFQDFPEDLVEYTQPYAPPFAYVGIYDGHRGQRAAIHAAQHLHTAIVKQEEFQTNVEEALKKGFIAADEVLLKTAEEEGKWNDGCTAAVAILLSSTLYVANVGDAEVLVGRMNEDGTLVEPVVLSKLHKPSDPEEKARIMANGGMVLGGRVGGALAVARALGDLQFKVPSNEGEIQVGKLISEEPDTKSMELIPLRDHFMVVACDGVFESLSYADVVKYVEEHLREDGVDATAEGLCKEALAKGSADNISAAIVRFNWG